MKRFIILLSFPFLAVAACAQYNLQLRAILPDSTAQLANIGGYADSLGREYALVGTTTGLSIVDVTNPSLPVKLFAVPGVFSGWREIKTFRHYAYVTNENGDGIQIIDLQYLPDSVPLRQWHGDGAIAGNLLTCHSLHIDSSGFLYLYGCGTGPLSTQPKLFNGAAIICDIATDPWNPHYLGHTTDFGTLFPSYVHDGYVSHDTLWAAHIWQGVMNVWDCSNKSLPVLLATQATPGNFTHNTWLSDDHSTIFTTDEVPNSVLTAYDISDLSNIRQLSTFQTAPGSNATVHNVQILNNYAITSWYTEGVVITDVSRPGNPVEVGKYDTSPDTGGGFNGCWGVYPYLPSGTIVASDIQMGLYVFTPAYVRGCYLEGIVTDSATNVTLPSVLVTIDSTPANTLTKITGSYKTGYVTAGTYTASFSKTGYVPKDIPVTLVNGQVTNLSVQLALDLSGIEELSASSYLDVFPNPSTKEFQIRYDIQNLAGPISIFIMDIAGRVIRDERLQTKKGTMEIAHTAPGTYFISLKSSGQLFRPVKAISIE